MQNNNENLQIATFAAGCFWGIEETFRKLPGVIETIVSYTGGNLENPTYKQVCSGKTGHTEAVQITFNLNIITYERLLDTFWEIHNPTTLNRQGPDIDSQYRSAIFYHNDTQKQLAEKSLADIENSKKYKDKVVTEITKATQFYKAEEYHQKYLQKNNLDICHLQKYER